MTAAQAYMAVCTVTTIRIELVNENETSHLYFFLLFHLRHKLQLDITLISCHNAYFK